MNNLKSLPVPCGKHPGLVFILLSSLLLAAACSPPVRTTVEAVDGVYEYKLDNGLKILVQPDNRSPVVVSQVWYKIGSRHEHGGITGLSHMLEHMMFKGTRQYGQGEFSRLIELNGGRHNAATSRDYTWYFQSIASDRLELCLKLEADRMRNVIFDEAELLKERDVVAEERRRRTEDNPQAATYEQFIATAYLNSPYQHPTVGWMEDIQAYTVADTKRWYDAWYAPNNATLVVVGDVQPGEVFRLAKKYFGPLKSAAIPEVKPQGEVPQQGQRRIEVHRPAQLPLLLMGYKAPTLATAEDPADVYALEVLAGILDGGESARLNRNLVRGRQIAASAGVSYRASSYLEELFLLSATPVGSVTVKELEKALRDEIEKIKNGKISDAELARIKAQVIAADVYARDSMEYQAMQLGMLETNGLGWRRIREYLQGVQAVTAEQVQAVARKYLDDRRLTVAELVPEGAAAGRGAQ